MSPLHNLEDKESASRPSKVKELDFVARAITAYRNTSLSICPRHNDSDNNDSHKDSIPPLVAHHDNDSSHKKVTRRVSCQLSHVMTPMLIVERLIALIQKKQVFLYLAVLGHMLTRLGPMDVVTILIVA